MNRTHRLVSGSTALVVVTTAGLPIYVAAGAAGVAAVSSSWPDDVEKPLHLPHRGVSHWPLAQLLVLALPVIAVAYFAPALVAVVAAVAAAAWIGCVMHSCADAMTVYPRGIALLWPISRRGYHLLPRSARVWVGTNSRSEYAFVVVWIALVLLYLYVRYGHYIQGWIDRS